MSAPNGIILYHYQFSPFARRVVWYLTLRGIPYAECLQPLMLPRPDLERLGISYRRIPILALGSSVYCDTRLILSKLEAAFPDSKLASSSAEEEAIRQLLANWTIDGGIFARASQMIPPDLPLLKDSKFVEDRIAYSGHNWSEELQKALRPEAIIHIQQAFDFLENGFLADGRKWILKSGGPSLADIEAIWPFHWLNEMKTWLPEDIFNKDRYPRALGWMQRFDEAIADAQTKMDKPVNLSGEEAAKAVMSGSLPAVDAGSDDVDEKDPIGLRQETRVESYPTDSGALNRDCGTLVKLSASEAVLENDHGVKIHHPRWNFRIHATKDSRM